MKTTILLTAALLSGAADAQTHKVTAPESVVRAIGVYEWTGDLAKPTGSRFVPVTLFIDGELQDAGIYLPRPVPFALVSGNVYELEDAGMAKGTVELESALKTTQPEGAPGPAFDTGWTAYGSYKAPATPRYSTASTLRPSKNPPVIITSNNDTSRPHFSNKSGDASNKSDASKPADAGSQPDASKQSSGGSTPKPDDDPDRPTMKRRSDDPASTGGGSASGGGPGSTTSPDDEADRPTLKHRSPEDSKDAKKKNTDVATVRAAGSLNDDPDRPTLHHGGAEGGSSDMPKLMGVPKDMHQMVAVSDAKNRSPHPFARSWESDQERATVLAKMQAFAREKLAAYGVIPGVTPPQAIADATPAAGKATTAAGTSAEPAPPTLKRGIPTTVKTPAPAPEVATPAAATKPKAPATAAKTTAAKSRRPTAPASVALADEELKGYSLSYGGAPTYVYMAHTVETGPVMRYVTLVAQADAMGELKLAISSVTDATHLDRTPWMRLVDAVDVEASNRASLLFELRGQSSRQFALYRVIATKPEQIFVTSSGL